MTASPAVGAVSFGDLRRVDPIARAFGTDRGLPIDRYYIESFLDRWRADIRGVVLEIAEDRYTRRFGTDVTQVDVLHVDPAAPGATIIADLTQPTPIPAARFDAIILTQTLQFLGDAPRAVAELNRILKPGGVLLATAACISQISRYDADRWGDYWRFTSAGLRKLFSGPFASERVTVQSYGNFLTSIALLAGLACDDLLRDELDSVDPDYEVIVGARAVK